MLPQLDIIAMETRYATQRFRVSTHAHYLGEIQWRERTINTMHLMARDGGQAPNVIDTDTQVYLMYVRRCARVNVCRVNAKFQKTSKCK